MTWSDFFTAALPIAMAGGSALLSAGDNDASGSQTTTATPGQMPKGGDAAWDALLERAFGTDEQPGLETLMGEQGAALRKDFDTYRGQMEGAIAPYQNSIIQASLGAIPVSMGEQKLGGLVPTGGIDLAQRQMAANSIIPETQWQFNQAMPLHKEGLDYTNWLQQFASGLQNLSYGLPSERVTANTNAGGNLTSALENAVLGFGIADSAMPQFKKLFNW